MSQILVPVAVIGGMGLLFGALLGIASKIFAVKVDERIPQIVEVLPGANCGGCGFAGCNAYAAALAAGKAAPNQCPAGGAAAAEKIAAILGVTAEEKEKTVARVLCNGNADRAKEKFTYDGPMDCHTAMRLGGGDKVCAYGCLGYGSCEKVCRFGAISTESGVAAVDEEKCVACGLCVKECPKQIIRILPAKSRFSVICSSKDKGKDVRSACQVGCIGCGICAKNCPKEAITLENNLAHIDPERCVNCGICAKKCPQHTICKNDALGVHFVMPSKAV